MVVSKRELVSILLFFDTCILFNSEIYNTTNIDMEINTPRGQSANSNTNNSREVSVQLSISSISYIERIKAQNNNLSWAD